MVDESGLSLKNYVETRFNLLIVDIDSRIDALRGELTAFVDNAKIAQAASDLRYQQRFEAQSAALGAAAVSQQTAMSAALAAAEKAVQAALAAADRAVAKTELSADKRFESLEKLIKQQFDSMTEKLDTAMHRVEAVEGRLNIAAGELSGNRRTKDDTKALWAVAVSVVAVLLALATFLFSQYPSTP